MKEKMNLEDIKETTLVEKEISSSKKKEEKKAKKTEKKAAKKETNEKKDGFFKETRIEMKKVSWPSFKDVMKYTLATLAFCIIVAAFFILLNLGLSGIKELFV